jgi:hypothetical protein
MKHVSKFSARTHISQYENCDGDKYMSDVLLCRNGVEQFFPPCNVPAFEFTLTLSDKPFTGAEEFIFSIYSDSLPSNAYVDKPTRVTHTVTLSFSQDAAFMSLFKLSPDKPCFFHYWVRIDYEI